VKRFWVARRLVAGLDGRYQSRGFTPHCTVGESLMVWAVVTAVLIFIGGMLVVAYAATTADRK